MFDCGLHALSVEGEQDISKTNKCQNDCFIEQISLYNEIWPISSSIPSTIIILPNLTQRSTSYNNSYKSSPSSKMGSIKQKLGNAVQLDNTITDEK